MEEARFQFQVDLPKLSAFELDVLARLKSAMPKPLSHGVLCQPRTSQNLGYMNRLSNTGLVMQIWSDEENEMYFTLTAVGEQALGASCRTA
jgi:hypothetical protein